MMEKSSPREKRYIRTRQTILEAAQQLIEEQGPEGLSMRELAVRSEYSPSGLYEYFSSKDEIIAAVCEEGFRQLALALNMIPSDLSVAERLIKSSMAYLKFAAHHPEIYSLMFVHKYSDQNAMDETRNDAAYQALRSIIQDGLAQQVFASHAGYGVEEITYSCWAVVHGMAMLRLTMFKEIGAEVDMLNRRSIEGLVARLTAD